MAKKANNRKAMRGVDGRSNPKPWTKEHERELRRHSKEKTPVARIATLMKRTAGALRQRAITLGLPLGHRR